MRRRSEARAVPPGTDAAGPSARAVTLAFRFGFAALLAVTPGAIAHAASSKMPQMNFANPLTFAQIVWMAVIMLILYFLMARWALPRLGGVLEDRRKRIADDLEAARQARGDADKAVSDLNLAIRNAREEGQAEIAEAVTKAKEQARREAEALNAKLEAELERAEAEIDAARRSAVASLGPVAEDVAGSLVERLTGQAPDSASVRRALETASS